MLSENSTEYQKSMKNEQLQRVLTEIGLHEHEAKVYLAGLSLGPTTVLKLAKATELKRTTVYSVIETLKQKGLMRIELKGFKNLFAAESPEKLEGILEYRRTALKSQLPKLEAIYNLKGGESTIKYYEGLAAIKSIYEDLLTEVGPQEDYLVISDIEPWWNLDREYFTKFWDRRLKARIKPRILITDSVEAREQQKSAPAFNAEVRILPEGTTLPTNLIVTGRKVIIIQMAEPLLAIVIENPSVTKMHKEMFEMIWKEAER
jgi:sugar-specific transcriptional regulator TrmB